ncbi:MAG: ATP-binding protein [Bacteroidales bacterium]|nr:ATP-binding protein [Bacteroidales bacterium]
MLKRIAITGPESTGKSDLAKALAEHYNTVWVPEYARNYIDNLNRPYRFEDIETIARGQFQEEERKAPLANKLLFCDTEFIVTKVWSEYVFGHCSPWILDKVRNHLYDVYLLMDIDLPWTDDPQREHPHKREELLAIYKKELEKNNLPFDIVSGYGPQRISNAIKSIQKFITV